MPPILVPFVKYFDFQGRANRAEYWQFVALQTVVGIVLAVLSTGKPNVFGMLWSVGLFIPSISVAVRRFHDINRTGWWYVVPMAVFIVGIIIAISMNAQGLASLGAMRGSSGYSSDFQQQITAMGMGIVLAFALFGLSLLIPLIMHSLPGTPGPNRFGPSPNGDGAERIASVFDAPEGDLEPEAAPEPYKPVFDFGSSPAERKAPPPARSGSDLPAPRPATPTPRPMASPAAGPRPFGKRGL